MPPIGERLRSFFFVFVCSKKLRSASCLLLPVQILLDSSSYMIFSISTFVCHERYYEIEPIAPIRPSLCQNQASCLCFRHVGMMETQNIHFCNCLHVVILLISRHGKIQNGLIINSERIKKEIPLRTCPPSGRGCGFFCLLDKVAFCL